MPVGTKYLYFFALAAFWAAATATVEPKVEGLRPTNTPRKVFVVLPIAAPSHDKIFLKLAIKLLERGHHVTIVTSRPQKIEHPNLRVIRIKDPLEDLQSFLEEEFFEGQQDPIQKMIMTYSIGALLNKGVFESPEAKVLKDEKFDLVILESYLFQEEPILGLAQHLGCPAMAINPFGYTLQLNDFAYGPVNVAQETAGGAKKTTILDRVYKNMARAFSKLTYYMYYYPELNAMMHEAFPDVSLSYDVITNVSLTLISSYASLMNPAPFSHVEGKSSDGLKKWIGDSEDGFVYFSLGSALRTDELPAEKRNVLLASFGKLKQRVLLKWNGPVPADAPANCRFEEWVPQHEILAHPKLRLFVTNGGLRSIQESAHFGVALLGMPITLDDAVNLEMAVTKGFAQMASVYQLSADDLDEALNQVLHNSKYRQRSQQLYALFRSDAVDAFDKAVYYGEILMKLGDMKHFKPSLCHLQWYHYLFFDAIVAISIYGACRILHHLAGEFQKRVCGKPKKD